MIGNGVKSQSLVERETFQSGFQPRLKFALICAVEFGIREVLVFISHQKIPFRSSQVSIAYRKFRNYVILPGRTVTDNSMQTILSPHVSLKSAIPGNTDTV